MLFKSKPQKIFLNRNLSVYGLLLGLTYALAAGWWLSHSFASYLASSDSGICWPHFSNCQSWHFLTEASIGIFFIAYGIFAVATGLSFLWQKTRTFAFWSLILLEVIRWLFVFSDYRFRMNQHYMSGLVVLTFLFVPNKQKAITFLIPFFYFWAGLLKVNTEWISGAALYAPVWLFSGKTLPIATVYVILLELFMIWGLWSSSKKIRTAILVQLFVFHLWSFPVVGFYYPLMMYCLLSSFLLFEDSFRFSDLKTLKQQWQIAIIPTILLVVHFYSWLLPGDKALTGEVRPLTLHMFDALVDCEATATLFKHPLVASETRDITLPLVARIQCDPIVYLSEARRLCRENNSDGGFYRLDLHLKSKRRSESEYKMIIDLQNFCSQEITYSYLGFNKWILK